MRHLHTCVVLKLQIKMSLLGLLFYSLGDLQFSIQFHLHDFVSALSTKNPYQN